MLVAKLYRTMMRLMVFALTATVTFACTVDYLIWIPRSRSADPLYRFVKNGKAGFINSSGNVVLPPTLEAYGNYGPEFNDDRLEIDGRYINRTGKVVIDKGLYQGWSFSEGLAAATRKGENLWGFIDSSGQFVISPRFGSSLGNDISSFSDGLAKITVNDRVGYIDRTGNFVIKPELIDGSSFSDGIARVITEGPCIYVPEGVCAGPRIVGGRAVRDETPCKFTYIDKTGRVITKARFDDARDFSEGVAPVRFGNKWGFIDKSGAFVIHPRFEDAESFAAGLSRIRDHGLYGYIDKAGLIKITPQFNYAENFSDSYAVVGDGLDRYWYIDQQGNRATFGEFAAASSFFKGLAHVKLLQNNGKKSRAKFVYIDVKGRQIFTY